MSSFNQAESVFSTLPRHIQLRIDKAFRSTFDAISAPDGPPRKKRRVDVALADSGGGFVVPDSPQSAGGGGGFIVEDPPDTEEADPTDNFNENQRLPMSAIPAALQLLDLPPDDDQVLAVFRNAASGWEEGEEHNPDGGMVSQEDWRAVCAILLEHHAQEYEDSSDAGVLAESRPESDHETDDYQETNDVYEEDYEDQGSDDEYVEGPTASTSRRRARARGRQGKSTPESSPSPSSGPRQPTARQVQTALQAFALFFPSASPDELPQQRIMIKDIQRVAQLLKEKIKAEEVRLTSALTLAVSVTHSIKDH